MSPGSQQPQPSEPLTRSPEQLLFDPAFGRVVRLCAVEVAARWQLSTAAARRLVLSAIGEPKTLAGIQQAWHAASGNLRLARVIVRRRVIDLLRKETRPSHHRGDGPQADTDPADPERTLGRVIAAGENPHVRLERKEVVARVRRALESFSDQGIVQRRQAQLLQRYALDEVDYAELCVELACAPGALRVRVHKAMLGLRAHVQRYHPELLALLGRVPAAVPAAASAAVPATVPAAVADLVSDVACAAANRCDEAPRRTAVG